jgi:hypothetical protein
LIAGHEIDFRFYAESLPHHSAEVTSHCMARCFYLPCFIRHVDALSLRRRFDRLRYAGACDQLCDYVGQLPTMVPLGVNDFPGTQTGGMNSRVPAIRAQIFLRIRAHGRWPASAYSQKLFAICSHRRNISGWAALRGGFPPWLALRYRLTFLTSQPDESAIAPRKETARWPECV